MATRRRLPVGELRERLLTTAKTMIEESGGLKVSLAHLNMEEIIRAARVPRSSVYREWETKEAFYLDLMVALTEVEQEQSTTFDPRTLALGAEVLDRHRDRLDDPDYRRSVFAEVIRVAGARNYEAVTTSLTWQTTSALCAMLPSLDEAGRDTVRAAVTRVEGRYLEGVVAFLEVLTARLGFRVREPFTMDQLAIAGSGAIGGVARRAVSAPAVVGAPIRYAGLDGAEADWSLAALAYLAVAELMLEPIPGWRPPS